MTPSLSKTITAEAGPEWAKSKSRDESFHDHLDHVSKAVGLLTLTEGAGGFLPGVPVGCLGMGVPRSLAEAPTLSGAFHKGRGCVRPVSREQPHARNQRRP